eukprot:6853471-Pyramimonas_sp.AAC.1
MPRRHVCASTVRRHRAGPVLCRPTRSAQLTGAVVSSGNRLRPRAQMTTAAGIRHDVLDVNKCLTLRGNTPN